MLIYQNQIVQFFKESFYCYIGFFRNGSQLLDITFAMAEKLEFKHGIQHVLKRVIDLNIPFVEQKRKS